MALPFSVGLNMHCHLQISLYKKNMYIFNISSQLIKKCCCSKWKDVCQHNSLTLNYKQWMLKILERNSGCLLPWLSCNCEKEQRKWKKKHEFFSYLIVYQLLNYFAVLWFSMEQFFISKINFNNLFALLYISQRPTMRSFCWASSGPRPSV